MAIDYSSAVGQVRLLAADTDEANLLLTDEQVTALLGLEGDNVKRAAAAALETIARSEALISKKITTQDLSTDGPAVAKALLDSATALRGQADSDDYGLDVVDFDPWAAYRTL